MGEICNVNGPDGAAVPISNKYVLYNIIIIIYRYVS